MRAVLLREYGDANKFRYEETDWPPPAADEVLFRVHETRLNPID